MKHPRIRRSSPAHSEAADNTIEFEAIVTGDGVIRVPAPAASRLRRPGYVLVRLRRGRKEQVLLRRGITEDEVDAIAGVQMESREHVVRFLGAEGVLAGDHSFRRGGRRR